MGILEDAAVKAKEVLDAAGKKTNDIITVQKLRYKLSTLNTQMNRDYELLGRLQYDLIKNGEAVDTLILEQIGKIDKSKLEIAEVKSQIAEQKGRAICPACRAVQDEEAVFCSRCGKKLTPDAPPADE